MKKQIVPPATRRNTVAAIVEHLVENGMSQFSANQFIHLNIPALGEYRSLLDCMNNGEWDKAWNVVDMYLAGDFF